jgi:hypothetical protein
MPLGTITAIWNPRQAALKAAIARADRFDEAMALGLELHALAHESAMTGGGGEATIEDGLWDGLAEAACYHMPAPDGLTIAWNIWHITRIEDLTANLLLADGAPLLDDAWLARLGVAVRDTGNAMRPEEIAAFSRAIDVAALRAYRDAVGRRTREIIGALRAGDVKRKVASAGLARIQAEGGVAEGAEWLLEFWGGKTLAGIMLMPITRHQAVHLNDALRLKAQWARAARR